MTTNDASETTALSRPMPIVSVRSMKIWMSSAMR